MPSADESAFEALRAQVEVARSFDAAGLREAYAVEFAGPLTFDPNAAEFMDRIQASSLALSDTERTALGASGFVISTRREFSTFLRGLSEIYSEHLPVYISADALLEAIHSSYDTLLGELESVLLIDELDSLLSGMHLRLAASSADAETKADTDVYLTVARSLLKGSTLAPCAASPSATSSSRSSTTRSASSHRASAPPASTFPTDGTRTCSISATSPSSSIRRSPTSTLSLQTKWATPWGACCTWGRAIHG